MGFLCGLVREVGIVLVVGFEIDRYQDILDTLLREASLYARARSSYSTEKEKRLVIEVTSMENHPSKSSENRWARIKEALSILSSIYSVVLLAGLLVLVVVQIVPILTDPVFIEIARYSTVILLSVLASYIMVRLSVRTTHLYLEILNKILIYDMRIGAYFPTFIATAMLRKGKLEEFDYLLGQVKKKEEALSRIGLGVRKYPELSTLPRKGCINVIVEVSSMWKIPFEQLASYLCEKLGKDNAKRLVDNETILKSYGKDGVSMWKSIIE